MGQRRQEQESKSYKRKPAHTIGQEVSDQGAEKHRKENRMCQPSMTQYIRILYAETESNNVEVRYHGTNCAGKEHRPRDAPVGKHCRNRYRNYGMRDYRAHGRPKSSG